MLRPSFDTVDMIETSLNEAQHWSDPGKFEIPLLRALFRSKKPIRLGPHSPMFREGDCANHAYLIDRGVVRTYRFLPNGRRMLTQFLFPGDVVGLEFENICPFTAETIQEVDCYRLSLNDLELLREHSTRLQDEIIRFLRHRIAAEDADTLPLMHQQAEARIARLLITLARRKGCEVRNGGRIELPMPRADIADFVGLTIETVCRTFTKLKSERIIALLTHDEVQVTNAHRLRALVEEGD